MFWFVNLPTKKSYGTEVTCDVSWLRLINQNDKDAEDVGVNFSIFLALYWLINWPHATWTPFHSKWKIETSILAVNQVESWIKIEHLATIDAITFRKNRNIYMHVCKERRCDARNRSHSPWTCHVTYIQRSKTSVNSQWLI